VTPFIQSQRQNSTLEHWKTILSGNSLRSFAAFAYVTDSGVAQLRTHLKNELENSRECRWIFSFDYGRSQPSALQKLSEIGNCTVRIYDGEYVVQARSFNPRVSCHLKTALTLLDDDYPCQQIVGSGNLSASGLLSGIEAGCLVDYRSVARESGTTVISALERMWNESTPLEDVFNEYQEKYAAIIQPPTFEPNPTEMLKATIFWIDIGYVTKNRGEDKAGNQFDLPKDSHIFLGLRQIQNPERNSVLGSINIRTPDGRVVERTLRFGNNEMEKLTLPIPEEYGYHSYDGKILTFTVIENEVVLESHESDDFYRIYSRRISSVREMRGGRKYGTIL